MPSGPRVFVAGALNVLQDLSNGSNIPALQPLVSLAVRIYTSAEGARNNKKQAMELAKEVCNSIKQILAVYSPGSSSPPCSTPDLHEDGVREFQRTLEEIAAFVERISQRGRLWHFLNQQENRQELSEYRMKIGEAKLQFLVTMDLAKAQIQQREQQYPVFTLADLELQQMLNPTNPNITRAIARLVPYQKRVIVRRYEGKSAFFEDIERLTPLRHPNLPFLGASSLMAPTPFIVMELASHLSAREVIRNLYLGSHAELENTAIKIIAGVLDGMRHLRENRIALSNLVKQLSSIQYDGNKIILNVELPKRKPLPQPRPTCSSLFPPAATAFGIEVTDEEVARFVHDVNMMSMDTAYISDLAELFVDIYEQENKVLEGLFDLPADLYRAESSAMPSALSSIWQYCMRCDPEHRLFDLRSISEQLHCGRVLDISPALAATGNLPYCDFPHTETDHPIELGSVACVLKSGHMVIICNILRELHDNGIIDMNQVTSTKIDEDTGPLQEGPFEESIVKGGGFLPECVGDYIRYECFANGWHLIEVSQTITVSLHNPADREIRRRIQEYFLQRLQSLLHEHSWNYQLPTNGFVLVTSLPSRRSTELTHNHDTEVEERSQDCLHCRIWDGQHHAENKNEAVNNAHIYFHAFPERVIGAMDGNCWGVWTMSIEQADGSEHELRLDPSQFSYTFERDCGFEGALVYLPSD
ncbi:hypothetical protein B0H11DRAFT_2283416 [Mycena galericulata]|nr:hypothetical protein B0H11DRAFT_2283416 [Mycena galericulata]